MYRIVTDFEGANCRVLSQTENVAEIEVEHRDTVGDWFFWSFRVDGAAGKTITFKFPNPIRVGYFGAAVSHDYENWQWQYADTGHNGPKFKYTFGEGEDSVYFAHDILYRPAYFQAYAASRHLALKTLCISEKGREVPYFDTEKGDEVIFLTARHHACESTGSYVLEGVLDALLKDAFFDRYRIICVPFVDYDGVVEGDQGKNRNGHDHNRDYVPHQAATYISTGKIREMVQDLRLRFAFDFHSPWHLSGRNDTVMIPIKHPHMMQDIGYFAHLFEGQTQRGDTLHYFAKDNMAPDVEWNEYGAPCFGTYMGNAGAEMAFTLETPYFLATDMQFTPERARATGHAFVRALKKYIESKA